MSSTRFFSCFRLVKAMAEAKAAGVDPSMALNLVDWD